MSDDLEITRAQARMILRAVEPLLREIDRRSAVGDSDLDDEQPIPSLQGVRLRHLRDAWWVRQWLGAAND
jgi:hypothetical protein